MKLNLDKQFVDLTGNPLPRKMDDTLAATLAYSTYGEPDKMHKWAVNLANTGKIEVDGDDIRLLMNFIKHSPHLTNLAKAQLLEEIEKATGDYSQDAPIQDDCDICEKVERDLMRKVKNLR
jgi:hypothetical protein